MTATIAKRPKARRTTSDAKATPTPKSTAYGRDVLRVLKAMQELGPWEFGPRISDCIWAAEYTGVSEIPDVTDVRIGTCPAGAPARR